MSDKYEQVSKFFEEARTNASLRAALARTRSEDDALEVARRFGYEFTEDDVAALKERVAVLDEEEMADVSGGDPPGAPITPVDYDGSSAFQSLSSGSRGRLLRGLQSFRCGLS